MIDSYAHDCSKCAKFCCFALKRDNPTIFIDPKPWKCDYCTNDWCRIYREIPDKSPWCVDYECFGVWDALSRVLGLQPWNTNISSIWDSKAGKMFIDRQAIARYLDKLKDFIKTYQLGEAEIIEFVTQWDIDIRYSLAPTIHWEFFQKKINALMKRFWIGINKTDNSFCRL